MSVTKKKLIEVALPLEAINRAAAEEKSVPRRGHPQTLHLWWARRPLAACRAVLFASLVDDPSSHPERFPTIKEQESERARLFGLIEELVKWENSENERVLKAAHEEILKSTDGNPPIIYDPFCGGGSIPLEAQRLGLRAYASDLNPVAVLITKALIEIPPRFKNRAPVNSSKPRQIRTNENWIAAQGLAEDIAYYGQWMREEAEKRIGHLYPTVKLPVDHGGGKANVVAWVWARTVASPDPALQGTHVPLVRSFVLSSKKNNEIWVKPIISEDRKSFKFEVQVGGKAAIAGTVNRRGGTCLLSGATMPFDHIRNEGRAGRMRIRLMAIVAEGPKGRVYLSPDEVNEKIAASAKPSWSPDYDLPHNPRDFKTPNYGMKTFADLFTSRQLTALTTFTDLVDETRNRVLADALSKGMSNEPISLEEGGDGATAYADAVAVYLACAISRLASYLNTICFWNMKGGSVTQIFARQAVPMSWDFFEINPLVKMSGNWAGAIEWVVDALKALVPARVPGKVFQADASVVSLNEKVMVCTDPPYYDNIGYADLSDFFYIWLRQSLKGNLPSFFSTIATPKQQELVASPYRFQGNKEHAKKFFEDGLFGVFSKMGKVHDDTYPFTVFYAFKQQEESDENEEGEILSASTGWETMLSGLLNAHFRIESTTPMRTERTSGVKDKLNALATSVVLACHQRTTDSAVLTRAMLIKALREEMKDALKTLHQSNIAPTDLAQAAIGPGMAVFSRYSKVLEADGSAMTVRTALALINQVLDELSTESEGDLDKDSRWCVSWFETHGFEIGEFGEANTLANAKATSVTGLEEAGVLTARAGKVRLITIDDLDDSWDPNADKRLTIWELTHHLIKRLDAGGEDRAAELVAKVGALSESARDLAYRLYGICERKKWAKEALRYNALVVAWSNIVDRARLISLKPTALQSQLSML